MVLKLFSRTDLAMPLLICHTPSEQNTIVKNAEKDDISKCFFALKKYFYIHLSYNLLMWLKPVIFLLIIATQFEEIFTDSIHGWHLIYMLHS